MIIIYDLFIKMCTKHFLKHNYNFYNIKNLFAQIFCFLRPKLKNLVRSTENGTGFWRFSDMV